MGVCLIHRSGSLFEATLEVTATPGSVVTAESVSDTNKKTYSGTAASNGKITFILKKKDSYTVTSNASGTQTKTVNASVNKGSYTTNITGQFKISSITKTHASLSIKRSSSPYGGGNTGSELAANAVIYYGDVLSLTGSANTGFSSYTIKVGSTTISNGSHTVTGDCAITASATPTVYKLTTSTNANYQVTVKRTAVGTAGQAAGATTSSSLANNASIYYGDALSFTPVPNPASYGKYTVTHGGSAVYSNVQVAKTLTVTNNVGVSSSINGMCELAGYYSWDLKSGSNGHANYKWNFPSGATLRQIVANSTWKKSIYANYYAYSATKETKTSSTTNQATLSIDESRTSFIFYTSANISSSWRLTAVTNSSGNASITLDTPLYTSHWWSYYKDTGT